MNKLPLHVVLWLAAAFISFSASVGCWFFVDKPTGLYIGLWVPSILALGCLLSSQPQRTLEEQRPLRAGSPVRTSQEAR